jgi:predicted ATPase
VRGALTGRNPLAQFTQPVLRWRNQRLSIRRFLAERTRVREISRSPRLTSQRLERLPPLGISMLRVNPEGEPVIESLGRAYRYNKRVFLAPPWPKIYTLDQERRQTDWHCRKPSCAR